MKIYDLFEAHYTLGKDTPLVTLKGGDTITVYHGFRDLPDAIDAARQGLSGRIRANRVYSYEFDNNPKGLFVTIDPKISAQFGSVIMEFHARASDLQAPVWPNGVYTVQGGYAEYFGRGREGAVNRSAARKTASNKVASDTSTPPEIRNSDDPHMSDMLQTSYERQALFMGDLSASDIVAWHIDGQRVTNEEFLERHSEYGETKNARKLFSPSEPFDGEEFAKRLALDFGGKDIEWAKSTLANIWKSTFEGKKGKAVDFHKNFQNFLWPVHYLPALRYMRDLSHSIG